MRARTPLIFALALLIAFAGVTAVQAQHDHGQPPAPPQGPLQPAPPPQAQPGQPSMPGDMMMMRIHPASMFGDFKLSQEEIEKIEGILESSEQAIRTARAEIGIRQAQISRLMVDAKPDMEKISALVKESLDWEHKVRMAQLERQISIRTVVGEERWGWLFTMNREFRAMPDPRSMMEMLNRRGMDRKDAEKWSKLFMLLRRLN